MTHLQDRAAQLSAAGRLPLYGYDMAIAAGPERANGIHIRLGKQGRQRNARYLALIDLDSHKPGQNADAARAALERQFPALCRKAHWKRSRGGKGWHAFVETSKRLPSGPIYDQDGNHIGELLSRDDQHTPDPGDIQPGILTLTEIEYLLIFWTVRCATEEGERWSPRGKQGQQWAAGWQRCAVTQQELRAFLITHCGKVGYHLDALFDSREPFDRSDKAGSLMQTIMFNIHKLPACQNADPLTRCRYAMAYWMAAESYGKAGEKDYNQNKDGYALIAKIVHQDPLHTRDGTWTCPFWAKSLTGQTTAPAPTLETPAPRPAHRPKGDKAKAIARLEKWIWRRLEDEPTGRIFYYVADLADDLGCSPRSASDYLSELQKSGKIKRDQIKGRGGRAYFDVLPAFWDARNSVKPCKTSAAAEPARHANECASEGIATPQSADQPPQCIEDHHNPSVAIPAPEPIDLDEQVRRDQAILADLWRDVRPISPVQRAERAAAPRQQRFTRGQGLAPLFARCEHHGAAPLPAHRPAPTARPAAAPAGADTCGVPLVGERAPDSQGLIARLRARQALPCDELTSKEQRYEPRSDSKRPVSTDAIGSQNDERLRSVRGSIGPAPGGGDAAGQ